MDDKIFHAYDVRGTYPDQINEAVVKAIAGAYSQFLHLAGKNVAVGRDVRLSSPKLQAAVIASLTEAGVNVIDCGAIPSELLTFALGHWNLAGGIQVTASHNPADDNGLYLYGANVEAISRDSGLKDIAALAQTKIAPAARPGHVTRQEIAPAFIDFASRFVSISSLPSLRIVANNNFGLNGPIALEIIQRLQLPIELIKLNFEPNGAFPKGQPDPLLPANRAELSHAVREQGANLGVAWDADGDRCYIVDEHGEFVEGCYLTALLAERLLKDHPGEKVIYDPRNVWAVEETVKAAGGVPIVNKAGHTFIKNRMKSVGALFAGEMSGHYYYRDFWGADSGILTFLLFLSILAEDQQPVSAIVAPLRQKYFVSGEINFRLTDTASAMADVQEQFGGGRVSQVDGLSIDHGSWRFNLRPSNTEPLLRLNVEARDEATGLAKTNDLTLLLEQHVQKAHRRLND